MTHHKIVCTDGQVTPVEDLDTFPGNPRIGDRTLIMRSLETHGQYRSIVVQKSTSYILAGNNTFLAALELGWSHVSANVIDVDDDTARRIVAIDNRANDLATYNERELAEFLSQLPDLDGTGYDPGDLDALVASLDAPDLDDLADELGDPKKDDGWPTINIRVPHTVKASWNAHLSTHADDEVAALCALLGIDSIHD